jgi:hypothetical protein
MAFDFASMHVIVVRRVSALSRCSAVQSLGPESLYRAAASRTSTLIERDGIGTNRQAEKNWVLLAEVTSSGRARFVSTLQGDWMIPGPFAASRIRVGPIGKLAILLSTGVTKKRVHTRLTNL